MLSVVSEGFRKFKAWPKIVESEEDSKGKSFVESLISIAVLRIASGARIKTRF